MKRGPDWAMRVERALWHWDIGLRAFNARLPVDGWDVAYRMAAELQDGVVPDPPKRPRAAEVARPGVG
jgi:hypothetical protein